SVEEMSCEALRATVPRRASGIAIVSATDVAKRRPCALERCVNQLSSVASLPRRKRTLPVTMARLDAEPFTNIDPSSAWTTACVAQSGIGIENRSRGKLAHARASGGSWTGEVGWMV